MTAGEAEEVARTRKRLSPSARKALLVVHIGVAVAWLGVDVVLGVLVLRTVVSSDPTVVAVSYQAVELFAVWTLLPLGLLTLLSGIVLGRGTRWGVLRYRWVVVKLVIAVVLTALVPLALQPTVEAAGEYGRAMLAGEPTGETPTNLYFPPIVSSIALVVALVLAVYKPWGRTRRRRPAD
ncbi:hypothetical protein [Saccharomonospora saliphila]|uniref:hypothetical protein n=1 Tax=Saccharomonospora saliphila TaxID=369829 RepID=UPI0003778EC5|nr:hypothetical protein [Saccharomonospora saliphila]